jgi:hypothetical protein
MNILDKLITKNKFDKDEIYQARWVWYHTLLCGFLFVSVILQVGILVAIWDLAK